MAKRETTFSVKSNFYSVPVNIEHVLQVGFSARETNESQLRLACRHRTISLNVIQYIRYSFRNKTHC